MLYTTNPHNGKILNAYGIQSTKEVNQIIEDIYATSISHKKWKLKQRIKKIKLLGQSLRSKKLQFASLITLEMGKPIVEAMGEIEKCADLCDYYAKFSKDFLKKKKIKSTFEKSFVLYEPLGIILNIMPWNFPYWQVFRASVPAIMAGNHVILKHASNVSGCALQIETLFKESLGENILRTILVPGNQMHEVISNTRIRGISLTGSTEAGRKVASQAGALLKKCVLELGGNDAYIVLPDAELDITINALFEGRMRNNGQSCMAAKRWIIHEEIYNEFLAKAIEKLKTYTIGNPIHEQYMMGPLVNQEAKDSYEKILQKAKKLKCKIHLTQCKLPKGGNYVQAGIIEIPDGVADFVNEEIFAPLAFIYKGKNTDEMILMANSSEFGLGSGVFSTDWKSAQLIASKKLESGSSFVNGFVQSNMALPFGGIKNSGYGRELSINGIHEFVNIKTVVVKKKN